MGKNARLCALVPAMLLLCACAPRVESPAKDTPAPVEILELAPVLDTPAPTGEPDMLFEDDGDMYFSEAFYTTFAEKTFAFDHAPRVLIYHTHAKEAFREAGDAVETTAAGRGKGKPGATADPAATPTATPTFRSDDPEETVVHLGALLAEALTARGFTVFHDATDVEAPALSTAYERSLFIMQRYDDIDLYIDLHRNAANVERAKDDVATIAGERVARMFFVVGTGLTAADGGSELPNWRENYVLARSLTEALAQVDAALVKPVRVKQKAYNQQTGLCLLAEIGHNANLLTDAENTIPYFADALAQVIAFP